jgi:hypothetical protein
MTGALVTGYVPEDAEGASSLETHFGLGVLVITSFIGRVQLGSSRRDSPIPLKWECSIVLKCVQFWDDDDRQGIPCSPLMIEELQY